MPSKDDFPDYSTFFFKCYKSEMTERNWLENVRDFSKLTEIGTQIFLGHIFCGSSNKYFVAQMGLLLLLKTIVKRMEKECRYTKYISPYLRKWNFHIAPPSSDEMSLCNDSFLDLVVREFDEAVSARFTSVCVCFQLQG